MPSSSSQLLLIVVICGISLATVLIQGQACSEKPWETVHRRLATKTPYRHVFRDGAHLPVPGDIDGCQVRRTWGLFRHGTRNPSKKVIDRMNTDLVDIRDDILQHGKLCKKELEMFQRWKPRLKMDQEKTLVDEGADEMQQLGKRFRARYGRQLPDDYRKEDFYFKFTKTERAENSARNFSLGLFGRTVDVEYPTALSRDPVLRFYKLCQRWRTEIKENPKTVQEVELFYNSKPMKDIIGKISKKVGTYLDADSIYLMYQACAFETAWSKKHTSPWCTLFDKSTIKLLEFGEDLEYYWIDGYGHELTYEQACSAFGDLLKRFDGDHEPHTFYFTHSGTLLKVMAFLGMYRDDYTLTHKDYERKRQWRVSEIDAFATNLVFTQLECTNGTHVMLNHQERPVHIPGCPRGQILCDYDHFKRLFGERMSNCAFDTMCSLDVPRRDEL